MPRVATALTRRSTRMRSTCPPAPGCRQPYRKGYSFHASRAHGTRLERRQPPQQLLCGPRPASFTSTSFLGFFWKYSQFQTPASGPASSGKPMALHGGGIMPASPACSKLPQPLMRQYQAIKRNILTPWCSSARGLLRAVPRGCYCRLPRVANHADLAYRERASPSPCAACPFTRPKRTLPASCAQGTNRRLRTDGAARSRQKARQARSGSGDYPGNRHRSARPQPAGK